MNRVKNCVFLVRKWSYTTFNKVNIRKMWEKKEKTRRTRSMAKKRSSKIFTLKMKIFPEIGPRKNFFGPPQIPRQVSAHVLHKRAGFYLFPYKIYRPMPHCRHNKVGLGLLMFISEVGYVLRDDFSLTDHVYPMSQAQVRALFLLYVFLSFMASCTSIHLNTG